MLFCTSVIVGASKECPDVSKLTISLADAMSYENNLEEEEEKLHPGQ